MLQKKYSLHQGKATDKWDIYLRTYERLLGDRCSMTESILEIGIQNGGSLEVWADYFRQAARIIGCDINQDCAELRFDDPRVSIVVGDANKSEVEDAIAQLAPKLGIIIDDGSHLSSDIVRSFARYFPRLSDGGLYIVEDLHCSYWKDFEGGLADPASSMTFFKLLADVINHEHWGFPGARRDLLAFFENKYSVSLDEEALAHIHRVEFVNSMCVIGKNRRGDNVLGKRIVRGARASVAPGVLDLDGTSPIVPPQNVNPWANLDLARPDTVLRLGKEVELLTEQLQKKENEVLFLAKCLESRNAEVQNRDREILKLTEVASSVSRQLHQSDTRLNEIYQSASWRLARPIRSWERLEARISRVVRRLSAVKASEGGNGPMLKNCFRILKQQGPRGVRSYLKQVERATGREDVSNGNSVDFESVAREIFAEQQGEFTQSHLKADIARFECKPLISVVMPVYKTPVQWLARVIDSLQEQVYENWELCAVDDCSPTSAQREVLERYASQDPRVRYHVLSENGGISTASNEALAMAKGEYIALVDHDDEITPDAFYWIVKAINDEPETEFLYSDECKIDDTPARHLFHFFFKPDWSPEMLFNGMLTGHLTIYSTDLVRRLGGFRRAYDFSQDYDLALRAGQVAKKIVHIERVLYLWRSIPGSAAGGGKDFARESNIAALSDYLVRAGINGLASPLAHANRVAVVVPQGRKVSIVIPSDSHENLSLAISSLLGKTDYPDYEIVAVCNTPLAKQLAEVYEHEPRVRFSPYDKKYNFSDKCNQGALDASGEVVVFYNDDVFPGEANWLTRLIEYLDVPGVGGVSPKLLYKNETIQYAGMISGTPGLCGTAYNHVPKDGNDSFLSMHKYVRSVSVLSGACCAFKRSIFLEVGGFDAVNTPDGHSDMVLTYKLISAGYRCIYTPHSVLFHIGHGSWNIKRGKYKADIHVLKRWGRFVSSDPWFTDSMKRVLYTDFRFEYKIYASHLEVARQYTGDDILLVSHELSLTGAPRMLLYAAKSILEQGGFPVVVSPVDGPLRQELISAGIAVIIDESIGKDHFLFGGFAKNFDSVIVNTIAMESVIRQLQKFEDLRLIWWLHEGRALASAFRKVRGIDASRLDIWCVSDYAKQFVPKEYRVRRLYNAVPDVGHTFKVATRNDEFTFLLPGTLEPRKGQDIFVEAIRLLPQEVRAECRFVLLGKLWEMHKPFWNQVLEKARDIPEFQYVGLLGHDETLAAVGACDVVVCCSRDESFSLTVVEAAMLGKASIVSERVGVAEALEDGVSCLRFVAEDPVSLSQQMRNAFERRTETHHVGKAARRVFEERFAMEHFSNELHRALTAKPGSSKSTALTA